MRNLSEKWWMKCIAIILCIAGVIMGAASLVAMFYDADYPKGELLDSIYERIADNYSAKILEDYNDSADEADFLKKVEKDIDPQLRFAIVKSSEQHWHNNAYIVAKEIDAFGADAEYLYGSAEDVEKADYWTMGGEDFYSFYSTTSLFVMLQTGYTIDTTDLQYEEVSDIVYDAGTNIFYYETTDGYYPVHSVVVTDEQETKTYVLTELEQTELPETTFSVGVDESVVEINVTGGTEETSSVRLAYLDENGGELATLEPGSYVQLENNTGAIRELTEDEELAMGTPGSYVLYVPSLSDITSEKLVHGYENTYIENGLLVLSDLSGDEYYYVFSYVDESVSSDGFPGFFAEAKRWVNLWEGFVSYAILIEILSVIVFLATFLFLMYAAGHHKGCDGTIRLKGVDTVWLEIVTLIAVLAEFGIGALVFVVLDYGVFSVSGFFAVELELGVMFCLIPLLYAMTIAARIKAKQFWRYTILYWCWRAFVKIAKKVGGVFKRFFSWVVERHKARMEFSRTHGTLVLRSVILLIIMTLVLGVSLLWCTIYSYDAEFALFWFAVVALFFWIFTLSVVMQMAKLQEGSRRIAGGDLSTPIDTRGLFWEFKVHAENINKVGDGIANAVEKQMKSERFKTELITNVSHDIKTPLTSIISYVDLIEKENVENEQVREYIEVLDRQSARLKKLIEDLMEASKASTGNLAVHFENCDARVLLTQIVGEFEEKTAANELEMIVSSPEEEVPVRVDSRHIWRVFDNLLGNICKYAQANTRVYISLVREGNDAVITFKNISKYPLNISGDELMERFVRGDSSRNTEGSGLGLSIAQSLTTLMKGTMELSVDGDLFKVTLHFPVVDK
jgi:signal transduction histidine kinase